MIALGAMMIGSVLGLLAGYLGGLVDSVIMRWVDLMYALPALLVAIVVVGVLGGGYWLAVILLVILSSPYDTRIVRGATLEQRSGLRRGGAHARATAGGSWPRTSGRTCCRS